MNSAGNKKPSGEVAPSPVFPGDSRKATVDPPAAPSTADSPENPFLLLFHQSSEALLLLDCGGRNILDWNPAARTLLGYSTSTENLPPLSHIFPRQIRRLRAFCRKVLEEGAASHHDLIGYTSRGTPVPVTLRGWRIVLPEGEHLLIRLEDRTKRDRTEQALWESRYLFRTLIENMQEGVMIVDNDDVIQFINPRITQMLGYTEEELIGKVGYKLLFSRRDQKIIREKNRLRTRKIADRYEIRMRRKSGGYIWVQISGVPITDAGGNVVGSFGIITD
ncbi:MAG: PAS domain S-box protein, partial [Calditrichaeota bacterium]